MDALKTEQLPVAQLAGMGAPYNPRKIDPKQLAALGRSLRTFGAVEPVVANRRSGRIVGGHQRVKAAQAEHIETLPVVWVDLDPVMEKQLNLALNRISGEWDEAALAALLEEMGAAAIDLTGFDSTEVDELIARMKREARGVDPDEVPEPPKEARTKPGDLYVLGKHRLLCGDATKAEDVARVMGGEKAALCLTDPPYGIGENYKSHKDTRENLAALINGFLPIARDIARVVLLTPGNSNQRLYPEPTWTLAWFVPAGTGKGPWGFSCWQPVLAYGKDPYLAVGKGSRPDVLTKTEGAENSLGHPCPKPVGVWSWFMSRGSAKTDDLVFDPFLGSGTSLIAAEQLNRRCFGLEIDPIYCDVIVERWENFTGQKATLEVPS